MSKQQNRPSKRQEPVEEEFVAHDMNDPDQANQSDAEDVERGQNAVDTDQIDIGMGKGAKKRSGKEASIKSNSDIQLEVANNVDEAQ